MIKDFSIGLLGLFILFPLLLIGLLLTGGGKTDRILFIKRKDFTANTVDKDLEILQSKYDVTMYDVDAYRVLSYIKQFFYILFNGFKYDLFYIWFADYHSFIPALLSGGKCVINAGGYDADEVQNEKSLRGFCTRYSFKKARKILAVSEYTKQLIKCK